MEGSWKSARIAFYAFCSTFAFITLAFTVYYLTNHKGSRKTNRVTDTSIRLHDETAASCSFCDESELAEILEKNGHGEFAKGKISSLLRFIETAETHMVEKLLVILLNCSAFTANQVKCLCKVVSTTSPPHPHDVRKDGYHTILYNNDIIS